MPIGPYIADFACHAAALVVEIDGGQHFEPQHEARDRRRDAYLTTKGFRVLRFNNYDVGDTYRTVYTVRLAGAVYVLHVFQKKSKKGRATPKAEIDLIERRLREAERIARGEQ